MHNLQDQGQPTQATSTTNRQSIREDSGLGPLLRAQSIPRLHHFRFSRGERGVETGVSFAVMHDPRNGKGGSEDNYGLGWSFCTPNDQFSRKKGRMIALGRVSAGVARQSESRFGFTGGFNAAQLMELIRTLRNWESLKRSVSRQDAQQLIQRMSVSALPVTTRLVPTPQDLPQDLLQVTLD